MSASTTTSAVKLSSAAETVLTRLLFKHSTSRVHKYGLQSPLWFWTHRVATSDPDARQREVTMVRNLLQWFSKCSHSSTERVAVYTELDTLKILGEGEGMASPLIEGVVLRSVGGARAELVRCFGVTSASPPPEPLLPSSSPPPAPPTVAVVVLGSLVNASAVEKALLFVAEVGWTAPEGAAAKGWDGFRQLLRKFQTACVPFSEVPPTDDPQQRQLMQCPTLVGGRLPICCPSHPSQRDFVTGCDPFQGFCPRICLKKFKCGVAKHLCTEKCHPYASHTQCPFPCHHHQLPCGHECKMTCSAPCDCLHEVTVPLTCSHQKIVGLDRETQMPKFVSVPHVFKGSCVNAGHKCVVMVPTECGRCSAPFTAPCCELAEAGHTLENRIIVCPNCQRLLKSIRNEARVQLLREADERKEKLRSELRSTLHAQTKAASKGVFQPGQRVFITNPNSVREPIETDFPNVIFEPVDGKKSYAGSHGVVISRHVDIVDMEECQYLLRMPSGRHLLVSDGGLQLIKAFTSHIVPSGSGGPLMITDVDHHAAAREEEGEGDAAPPDVHHPATAAEEEATEVKCPIEVGTTMHTIEAIPYEAEGELEDGELVDAIVAVVGPIPWAMVADGFDPAKHVMISATILHWHHKAALSSSSSEGEEAEEEPKSKKTRGEGERNEKGEEGQLVAEWQTITTMARVASLEPVLPSGKEVIVTDPTKQIPLSAHSDSRPEHFTPIIEQISSTGGSNLKIMEHFVAGVDEPCTVVGAFNAPKSASFLREVGPCYLLKPKLMESSRVLNRQGGAVNRNAIRSRSIAVGRSARNINKNVNGVIVVPLVFVGTDEQAEAELALDREVLAKLDAITDERYEAKTLDMQFCNEQAAFERQKLMPPYKEKEGGEQPVFSVPVPLLTGNERAALEEQFVKRAHATKASVRDAVKKDVITAAKAAVAARLQAKKVADQRRAEDELDAKRIQQEHQKSRALPQPQQRGFTPTATATATTPTPTVRFPNMPRQPPLFASPVPSASTPTTGGGHSSSCYYPATNQQQQQQPQQQQQQPSLYDRYAAQQQMQARFFQQQKPI